ncbi:MAG: exodeoxyribonuclease VII large subunit [Desulfovibrio sp.]|nr:exodeoxyribonuclease VII large subunit [Desulfovibrio sp.]
MQGTVLTVRALTEQLRKQLEGRFPFVWVRGEVSNLSRPASGHVYFSLKDSDAQLQCVWFRGQQGQAAQEQSFDPLTGEVFEPPRPSPLSLMRNGLDLLCAGRISVYPARGQYQLVVEMVQPAGEGLLAQAFEERKRQLAALGYFALARKRLLPWNPQRVALITSPGGAAVHDFVRVAQDRGCPAQIRLFPVPVQGEEAAPAIVKALECANSQGWAQVVVLIRGGGSLEDLWAFNETALATAVFQSALPVLVGVGHEVDVTLADMTADMRAATPSHAALLLWPTREELRQRVDEAEQALQRTMLARLERAEQSLRELQARLYRASPVAHQIRLAEKCTMLEKALRAAGRDFLARKQHDLTLLEQARLAAWSHARLSIRQGRLDLLQSRLGAAAHCLLTQQEHALQTRTLRLTACDPLAPLQRGYALLRAEDGLLLRSVTQTRPGERLGVRLADGEMAVEVVSVRS